jgi:hypothetical protein
MQDLQCFILDLEEGMKRAPIFYLVQKVLLCILRRKTFCTECFRLKHFNIKWNIDEYKLMGQDLAPHSQHFFFYVTYELDQ